MMTAATSGAPAHTPAHPQEWPRWMAVGCGGLALLFAAFTVLIPPRLTHPVGVALLGIALLPWLIEMFNVALPDRLFAAWAFLPLAVLNTGAVMGAFGTDADGHDLAQFSMMLVILLVGAGATTGPPKLSVPLAAAATAVGVIRTVEHPAHFAWVMGIGFAFACGLLLRRQQAMVVELRTAQAALAREAALEERQRIAREIHDLVAHTLTITMLHLSAARMALTRAPDRAAEALAEAERLGRQSLADIRRTVGLLRGDGQVATAPALPGLGELDELIDRYAAAGLRVERRVSGGLDFVAPAVGLTLYRLVQEALANAAKHAPGAAVTVTVDVDLDEARVDVRDDGGIARERPAPIEAAGLGLKGMRERIEPLGGALFAGPADGGWAVTCRLPLREREPADRT